MKHTRSLFTLASALLILLCACSDAEGAETKTSDTVAGTTTAETEQPDYVLPPLDYEGASFSMLVGEGYNECFVDGESGDVLDDAKWQMQRTVEEGLNITISETPSDFWQMTTTVKQYIMAGDDTYDAIAMMDRFALTSAMENCFIPMQDIASVHLDQVWWGTDISSHLSVGGNQYFGIGSFQLETFGKTACILINKKLAAALNVQIPYDDVFAGTWTFDDLAVLEGVANQDLNGNGEWDNTDRYTYGLGDPRGGASIFWQACGMNVVTKDDDDIPHVTVYDDQQFFSLLERLHGLMYSGENNIAAIFWGGEKSSSQSFMEGNMLMLISTFYSVESCREMEDDFAILPMPKYDEAQEKYRSRTYDSTFFMVPITQEEAEFSGAVLDALSCVGYYDMLPVFINKVLKDKASRDEQSMKSIQICFDTRTLDMGEAFLSDYFGDGVMFDNVMSKSSMNMASYLEKKRKSVDRQLERIVEVLTEEE